MQAFITAKRREISELCRRHHVCRLAIFGSALRSDFEPSRSDIDVLVEFEDIPIEQYADNKLALENELQAMFHRRVDLLTWKSISNAYLLDEVESTQEMIYAA